MFRHHRTLAVILGVLLANLVDAPLVWAVPTPTLGFAWGSGGGSADLGYYFDTPTADLSLDAQHNAIAAALGVWSSVAAVTFEAIPSRTLDSISFTFCSFHTCHPEQPANVLALTSIVLFGTFPLVADVFFNDDVQWEIGNDLGSDAYDLMFTAVHETGHALGLAHSSNPNSVMFPLLDSNQVFAGLNQEDIDGILNLYRRAPVPPHAPVSEPTALVLMASSALPIVVVRRRWMRQP